MAYLDRHRATPTSPTCRDARLAGRTGRPTTFGWGPRFLHSTGQYHKGGPAAGRLPPGHRRARRGPRRSRAGTFTFGGSSPPRPPATPRVLADHGRPVLRLHLTDQASGLAALREALR